MTWLTTWRIGARLGLGFGLIVVLMLGVMAHTVSNLSATHALSAELLGPQAERLALAFEWRENIVVNSSRTLAVGLAAESKLLPHFEAAMNTVTQRTTVIQKRYAELETTPEGLAAQQRLAAVRQRYLAERAQVLAAQGDPARAAVVGEVFKRTVADYIAEAQAMVAYQQQRAKAMGEQVDERLASTRNTFVGAVGLAAVMALGLGLVLTRSITRPLARLQASACEIARGHLADTPVVAGSDELGQLQEAMNQMQLSLREVVGQVRQSTDAIRQVSAEVASGNADLSQRTDAAAMNLQLTASSMEELSGTVRASTGTAEQASQVASSAQDVARQGGDAVQGVVCVMAQISESSRRIAEITGVIDGIAFQTNILALNAAVEAARAGEQGRGFAVVAGEVRVLAQRSAAAAREIKGLIADSVQRVDEGGRMVEDAGRTMAQIVQRVQQVHELIGEITVAAREQSQGLDQVNGAMAELDRSTQQNVSLVGQSSAAAQSMQAQAGRLTEVVSGFQL